jgi:hypothetical protein
LFLLITIFHRIVLLLMAIVCMYILWTKSGLLALLPGTNFNYGDVTAARVRCLFARAHPPGAIKTLQQSKLIDLRVKSTGKPPLAYTAFIKDHTPNKILIGSVSQGLQILGIPNAWDFIEYLENLLQLLQLA